MKNRRAHDGDGMEKGARVRAPDGSMGIALYPMESGAAWAILVNGAIRRYAMDELACMPDDGSDLFEPDGCLGESGLARKRRPGEYEAPAHAPIRRCSSCGAEIVWTKTIHGKAIPLSVATIEQDLSGRRFALTHFADCPDAKRHRKRTTSHA